MPRPAGPNSHPKASYDYKAVFTDREEPIRRHEREGFVFRDKWYLNLGQIKDMVRVEGGKVTKDTSK